MVNFINYCKIELGLAQNTLDAYQKDIGDLFTFSNGKQIRAAIVNEWIDSLKHLSQNSIRRKLMVAHTYFRYLIEVNKTHNKTEFDKLNTIGKAEPIVKIISVSRIKQLYNDCKYPLDTSVVDLLYSSGMRATEACSLKRNSVSWVDKNIHIRGKGSQDRVVPTTIKCLDNLKAHLKSRLDQTNYLLTKNGQPLDRHIVYKIIKSVSKDEFSPHDLRHACATHLLDGGMPVEMIQRFLGHATLGTTQSYVHVSYDYLKRTYDQCWSK